MGKFASKNDDGIFVGYSSVSKAYRVYNLRIKVVEESMNVKFDETPDSIPQQSSECVSEEFSFEDLLHAKADEASSSARVEPVHNQASDDDGVPTSCVNKCRSIIETQCPSPINGDLPTNPNDVRTAQEDS